MKVVVLGAGIVGMTSALRIVEDCGTAGLDMTVMADKFSPNTTSDVAAGVWSLPRSKMTKREMQWLRWSHEYLTALLKTPYAPEIGLFLQSGWTMWMHVDEQDPDWKDLVQGYRHPTKWELTNLFPGYKDGFFCTTFMLESRLFLPWAENRLWTLVCQIQSLTMPIGLFVLLPLMTISNSVNSVLLFSLKLYLDHDIIVNCTGIGARDLVGDTKVVPSRGQIITVKAPWIKHRIELTGIHPSIPGCPYVISGHSHTRIGGIRQHGRWDLSVDPRDTEKILDGITTVFPSLKNVEILNVKTGLRPMREEIRLEREEKRDNLSGKTVQIIHNYGHGGNGIAWSFGCAKEVAIMVKQLLQKQSTKSRL
ncbi:D-amino-acid oxidase-like [Branchiostoma lanceolatum]|uniref:D-amino-acid oxidase-like n=1 Tax=Branchiostoma lanceolatum TaxID=7740 RepID=UPI003452F369